MSRSKAGAEALRRRRSERGRSERGARTTARRNPCTGDTGIRSDTCTAASGCARTPARGGHSKAFALQTPAHRAPSSTRSAHSHRQGPAPGVADVALVEEQGGLPHGDVGQQALHQRDGRRLLGLSRAACMPGQPMRGVCLLHVVYISASRQPGCLSGTPPPLAAAHSGASWELVLCGKRPGTTWHACHCELVEYLLNLPHVVVRPVRLISRACACERIQGNCMNWRVCKACK